MADKYNFVEDVERRVKAELERIAQEHGVSFATVRSHAADMLSRGSKQEEPTGG